MHKIDNDLFIDKINVASHSNFIATKIFNHNMIHLFVRPSEELEKLIIKVGSFFIIIAIK
ncbi:hypothetical protein BpHYR1_007996 [Brachionus plicatilis]|uniref:Uncharacterized protein n=1 Tax=Brachionus plicatilis TaxID=10195 RepID=A0A3M7R370_BRAPC|nr:hypothetical protein BpHYR1_007996 [Brachionus plicatilis]